ncbi:MAG: flavin-containing monooxygenase, partial [Myxococcales bacterium]
MQQPVAHVPIAIAGTGFGGLGMAIRLKQAGFADFTLFERADDVGGVWRDNTYPGCACDVESHLYSFSFAPNPTWSRAYSPAREIRAYLRGCAERFGILPHVRFGHEVKDAVWEEDRRRWRFETSQGVFTADVFIAGVGGLSEPSIPKLPGLETFRGKVMHSARWDHGYALEGRRVAVVGTGASAIQFVPAIQPKVGRLFLFQRTPPWILPRRDRAIPALLQRAYAAVPALQRLSRVRIAALRELMVVGFMNPRIMALLQRLALRYLKRMVKDEALRRKLTPDYTIGCKRILISDDYLPALTQPNVEVVTDGIQEIRPGAIVARDGTVREVDALIFGTGFHASDFLRSFRVFGEGGVELHERWGGDARAYLGT